MYCLPVIDKQLGHFIIKVLNVMTYLIALNWDFAWDAVKSLIVPLVGSAAGAWATIEVFRRQLAANHQGQVDELKRTISEDLERRNNQATAKLSNFVWLLNDALKFATKQNEDYLEVASKIDEAPLETHRLTTRASGTISRILSLKQEDIFASFIQKVLDTEDNKIHVARIYNKLDYIKRSAKSNKLKYQEHIETHHSLMVDYRQHIENIREIFLESLNNPEDTDNEFGSFANNALHFYRTSFGESKKSLGLDWHQEEFLTPLIADLGKNFEHDPRTKAIGIQVSRASRLVGRVRFSSEATSRDLKEAHKLLGESLIALKTEIDYVHAVLQTT
jgi:hypothetical protein